MKGKLYFFAHIPKTAGTAFINYVKKHLKKEEYLIIDYKMLGVVPDDGLPLNYKSLVNGYLEKLSTDRKNRLKFIAGHIIPYGIHNNFPDKKAIYITFLRNPYERVVSYYNYFRGLYEKEDIGGKKKRLYKNILTIDGLVPSFDAWFMVKYGEAKRVFSLGTMSDYFNVLGYKKSYFRYVGDTKHFKKDANRILKDMGLPKMIIPLKENVSKKFVKRITAKEIVLMERKLKKDFKLYGIS